MQNVILSYDSSRRIRLESTMVLEMNGGKPRDANIDFIINGIEGWISFNGKSREMDEEEIAFQKDSLEQSLRTDLGIRHFLLFKGKGYKLTPLGDSKVGDRGAVGINVSQDGRSDVQLYFDKDTGLPLKRSSLREEPATPKNPSLKPIKVEVLFDDYKEAGGIKYSTKLTIFEDEREARVEEITEFKIVEKFDEKTFAKPE